MLTTDELARLAYELTKLELESRGRHDDIVPWYEAKKWFKRLCGLSHNDNSSPRDLWNHYQASNNVESFTCWEDLTPSVRLSIKTALMAVKAYSRMYPID